MSRWLKHHDTGRIDDSLFYANNCNTGYAHTAWVNRQLTRGTGTIRLIEVIEASNNGTVP
jgi:hypothetical protein